MQILGDVCTSALLLLFVGALLLVLNYRNGPPRLPRL
jgi:hypothetical protein